MIKLTQEAKNFINDRIPAHMQDALIAYFEEGRRPGSFLEAVLANDLSGAFAQADHINRAALQNYVEFLWWHVPARPHGWGSYEAVDTWIKAAMEETA